MDKVWLRTTHGVTPAGSWEMTEAPIDRALQSSVDRLCGFAEDAAESVERTELPGLSCVFIVSFGAPYHLESLDGSWSPLTPRSGFVSGLGEYPAVDTAQGAARCVQVDLSPLGLFRLLGIPMGELTNVVISLEDILGGDAQRLAEQLDAAPTWAARLELIQRDLHRRMDEGPATDRRVAWAWNQLVRSGGRADVGSLAGRLEISRKHLIDLFRKEIGLPPKRAARLIRFSRTAELVRSGDYTDWTDLALDAGYFDQAHFINEVHRFSGRTPSELFAPTV